MQKSLDAIKKALWLADYFIHFSTSGKFEAIHCSFWLDRNLVPNKEVSINKNTTKYPKSSINGVSISSKEATNFLCNLPPLECRKYFGPRKNKLHNNSLKPTKKQRATSMEPCTSQWALNENPFSKFDPLKDVQVGHFVAMNKGTKDRKADIPFFLEKVTNIRNHSMKTKSIMVTWYWSKPTIMQAKPGMWIWRYQNCMHYK